MLTVAARKVLSIARKMPGMRLGFYAEFREYIVHKTGLEIGGPSGTFSDGGILPTYRYVKAMDNVVFSSSTVWEGTREEGRTFIFHPGKPAGWNYVTEASDLSRISDGSYDFLVAAHCLEHIANPLRALLEWRRVLKFDGRMVVIVPNYRKTFDQKRQPTSVEHMLEDYSNNVGEDDMTHLPEILQLHDLRRDRPAGTLEQFKMRALQNYQLRCLHHHVFDKHNSCKLLQAAGLKVVAVETALPHHIALLAHL